MDKQQKDVTHISILCTVKGEVLPSSDSKHDGKSLKWSETIVQAMNKLDTPEELARIERRAF